MHTSGPKTLSAAKVKELIVSGSELALLDLREEGTFGDGHLLFAVPLPLSRLEFLVDDLVPRRDVPIVLCAGGDGDDDLITRGADRLAQESGQVFGDVVDAGTVGVEPLEAGLHAHRCHLDAGGDRARQRHLFVEPPGQSGDLCQRLFHLAPGHCAAPIVHSR